jgi:hypothetical protein
MMEPLISICLGDQKKHYQPGEELTVEYQIDAVPAADVQAVEASVLWYTEGKGEEDLSVHYFERRLPSDAEDGDLRPMRRFRTRLPNSPLSYWGAILKVKWCVRVRLFLRRGKEMLYDYPFQLGSVPPVNVPQQRPAPQPAAASAHRDDEES